MAAAWVTAFTRLWSHRRCDFKFSTDFWFIEITFSQDPEWAWANQRHTWQSWRERYAKHKEHFNERIDEYLLMDPPAPDGKGQYERKRTKLRVQHSVRRESDEEVFEEEEEEEEEEEMSLVEDRQHTTYARGDTQKSLS